MAAYVRKEASVPNYKPLFSEIELKRVFVLVYTNSVTT